MRRALEITLLVLRFRVMARAIVVTVDSGPPPRSMFWERRFGAIANESNGGGPGAATGYKSQLGANQAALAQCQSTATNVKSACKILHPFSNQCGAYAWGGGRSTAESAVDLPTAKADALKECNRNAGSVCEIFYSGCSFAELVPK